MPIFTAKMMNEQNKHTMFQIGKTYTNSKAIKNGWPCGVYTITKRTQKCLWISENGKTSRKVMLRTDSNGVEYFKPYGAMPRAGVNVWSK